MSIEIVSRFVFNDRVLSALHAPRRSAATAAVTQWAQGLTGHALTWVGAFDDRRLVGFMQAHVVWTVCSETP